MTGRAPLLWAATLVVGVVLSLLAAELVARRLFALTPPVAIGKGAAKLTDEENRAAFEGDPELMWRLRRSVSLPDRDAPLRGVVSNEQGLREPAPVSREKAANELRILFLGESITFGWRLRHDQTFADRAGRILDERFDGVDIRALNAGVPAYSLLQGWRYLVTEGFELQPDLVVLGSFGFNDSSPWSNLSDFEQIERWQARQPVASLRWSSLAQLLADRVYPQQSPPSGRKQRPRLFPSEFREILTGIRSATLERGVELLVVIPGHEYNLSGEFPKGTWGPYQTVLADFGADLHLGPLAQPALVDGSQLLQALADEHDRSELLLDHVHPTALVHAALAEKLVEQIAPWIETQIRFGRFSSTGSR